MAVEVEAEETSIDLKQTTRVTDHNIIRKEKIRKMAINPNPIRKRNGLAKDKDKK